MSDALDGVVEIETEDLISATPWFRGPVGTTRYKDTKTSAAANFRLHDDVALEVTYRSVCLR